MVFTHRAGNYDDDKEKDNKNESKGFSTFYVVLISIALFIIIAIVLFLFIRHFRKKKQNNDFKAEAKTFNNEKLLNDI